MKKLTGKVMWQFAIGQLGWSLLAAIVTNWLVYFYQPGEDMISEGQTLFIPQGLAVLGIATIIGGIAALGRIFDAISDPLIANLSDRSENPNGRRIPFMRRASIPFAVVTVLIFWAPVNGISSMNTIWLLVMLLLFYLLMTSYCTPYNALIPELGKNQKDRINISTYISLTFILGSAIAYGGPYIWGALTPTFGRIMAIRLTFLGMAVIGLICLLVPTFTIREKDYVTTVPAQGDVFSSLFKTFQNRDFRIFVASDILYWIAITIFQTGLPFFVTVLMNLPETMSTILYISMTALSLVCYPFVNKIANKINKKEIVLAGYLGLSLVYVITVVCGISGFTGILSGVVIVILAAFPMAILGILPQAIVADIAQSDAIRTGENRDGMFYAARTFAFKLGQSVSMLLFTAMASIGTDGIGYRIAAAVAFVICLAGAIVLSRYNEKKVLSMILPDN